MHPFLRLSSLSHIPPSLKTAALKASRGSAKDMEEFMRWMTDPNPHRSRVNLPRLISVFYTVLDPDPIASLSSGGDFELKRIEDTANRALLAIRGVVILASYDHDLPPSEKSTPEVFREVWPRVWAWMQFHDTFRSVLDFSSSDAAYGFNVAAVVNFAHMPSLTRLVLDTDHFARYLGSAWAAMVDSPTGLALGKMHGLDTVSRILTTLHAELRLEDRVDCFEDLGSGAGGQAVLARLCVSLLERACVSADTTVECFRATYVVIGMLDPRAVLDKSTFRNALIKFRICERLPVAIRTLLAMPSSSDYDHCIAGGFCVGLFTLCSTLTNWSPPHVFVQCVQNGFLRALSDFTGRAVPSQSHEISDVVLQHMERTFLAFLTSHTVLTQLRESSADLDAIDALPDSAFADQRTFEAWRTFIQLARERLIFLQEFESKDLIQFRGCDNAQCGHLHAKSDLKCCGSCLRALYCSRSCQKRDWNLVHRRYCHITPRQRAGYTEKIDDSFVRALLNHSYQINKESIALELLRFFHSHPDDTCPYSTCFDYTAGACRITLGSLESLDPDFQRLYEEEMERARLSGGLYHLHFFIVGSWVLFPLHCTQAETGFYEGIRRIARGIPPSQDAPIDVEMYQEDIRAFVEATSGNLETH
ncbi:hypothetical protein C8F01DRAFT_1252442 [Mycena amicta]|nr:hypothetical protein C8F01DRAFT_1252442 [Mycena amicta]